ncbi:hypothetical protein GGI22_001692 [Coemansia erecta]|nr:hypothetical protein GGI22_001692 [Coemansia erecta]
MYSGDEDEDNTAENPPAISGEQYHSDDNRPEAPDRALSEEHGSGTIRSLTALALSSTQQQQQQQVSKTFIGGGNDNDDDGENDDKDIASAFDGSGTLLRSLLERVQNIEQYCRQLVQMQSQQAQHISALETTLQNTASNRTLSPRLGAASAGASESGAVSASTTASATTGVYPRTQQAHLTHGASGSGCIKRNILNREHPQGQFLSKIRSRLRFSNIITGVDRLAYSSRRQQDTSR